MNITTLTPGQYLITTSNTVVPAVTGQTGKVLGNDGTKLVWVTSGAGDATLAGNNTFTGTNAFTGPTDLGNFTATSVHGDGTNGLFTFLNGPTQWFDGGQQKALMDASGNLTVASVSGDGSGLTLLNAGAISAGTLPVARGGTGQTTAANAINALVPSQSGQAGNVLTSDGTSVSWTAQASASQFTGPKYYVDPVNGNDSNSGTLASNAWKTWAKIVSAVNANVVPAGGWVDGNGDAYSIAQCTTTTQKNQWIDDFIAGRVYHTGGQILIMSTIALTAQLILGARVIRSATPGTPVPVTINIPITGGVVIPTE